MDLDKCFGGRGHEGRDSARLRARLVLGHDPARRQIERKLFVRLFHGMPEWHGVETGSAVLRAKPVQKKPRSARMIFGGTRPEYSVRAPDALPGDAGVIGHAAC